MTNTDTAPTPTATLLDFIADATLEGTLDILDTMTALSLMIPHADFVAFCNRIDACPTHFTDLDTCRDDNLHCFNA